MKDIKTKESSSAPRELSNAARAPRELMRRSIISTKEQAEHTTASGQYDESPVEYAENRIERTADDAAHRAGEKAKQGVKNTVKKANDARKRVKEAKQTTEDFRGTEPRSSFSSKNSTARNYTRTRQTGQAAQKSAQQSARSAKGTIKTAERGSKAVKGTVKTAQKSVKTAKATIKTTKHTIKAAEKGVKTTAKATQKAAQAAAKAAKAAAAAAKAAAKAAVAAAKVAVKAITAIIKAIIAAVKALIAFIAAGGWVAVIIIVVVALIMALLAVFGVFSSNDAADGSKPMTEAIQTIDAEFKGSIDAKIAELSTGGYDEVEIKYIGDMDGDSDYIINWNDVIAVYSVSLSFDEENPTDTLEVTPEKVEKLREIFYDMNTVTYSTEVEETEVPAQDDAQDNVQDEDGEEETVTIRKLIISVNVQSMDYLAAADLYDMNADQRETLEIMMEPEMLPMYAELIGIDVYGGADLTQIISGLPAGKMGTDVLNVALTKVGSPYVLGAKGPKRFDCSGLVYWSINEIDPTLGKNLYTSAGYQYKYCKENGYLVGESEIQPGDLIFWHKPSCSCGAKYAEVHHTGFYLGDGMILDASSSNGRVIIRKLFDGGSYKVLAYARPYSY